VPCEVVEADLLDLFKPSSLVLLITFIDHVYLKLLISVRCPLVTLGGMWEWC